MIRSGSERDVRGGGDMTPERWQQVKNIFEGAVAEHAANRSAYLEQQCAEDTALRSEVETLLASDAQAMTVLGEGAASALGALMAEERQKESRGLVGRRLGHYRILEEIGRGGMALVYAAVRDDQQYQQRVAIKLIRRGMDTEPLIARFRQERQILANLDHPNIARLIDGGVTEDGLPYLVMEAIEGEPIDVYADRQVLTTTQRLELFRTVCAAVHYAHQNLVVHRDLKPSNILVTKEGVAKLLDFGIAKLLEPSTDDQAPGPTIGGPRPMTPTYASPEQLRGEAITTASDVYALGVLLYRLITGHRPFRFETTAHAEVARVVCGQDPERPSTVITRALPSTDGSAPIRSETLGQLRSRLRGDLDNIALMALEKQPQQRYASAAAFADDIRRHLAGEPVTARKDTAWYRTSRFVRRHRLGVAAAATVALSLVGGIAATTWQARVALAERAAAERSNGFLVRMFRVWDHGPDIGNQLTARELLDQAAVELESMKDLPPRERAGHLDTIGVAYWNLRLLDEAEPLILEALEIRQSILPSDAKEVATSWHSAGMLWSTRAEFDQAKDALERAIAIRRQRLGPRDPLVAQSENELGWVLIQLGELNAADRFMRASVGWQEDALGDRSEDYANALNRLALTQRRLGRLDEAEALYHQALEVNTRRFGPDHSRVAIQWNNLGTIYREQGDCEGAIELYHQALAIEEANLLAQDPRRATTLINLAGCLRDLGRTEEAECRYKQALRLEIASRGPDHPGVALGLSNLGTFAGRRSLSEAAELYSQAVLLFERSDQQRGERAAKVHFNLAATLRRLGRDLDLAEVHARRALELDRAVRGREDQTVTSRLTLLGKIQIKRGSWSKAERNLREAVARRSPDQPADKPLAELHIDIGRALIEQDRAQAAAPSLTNAIDILEGLDGDETRARAVAQGFLVASLIAGDDLATAEALWRESHPVLLAAFGEEHPLVKASTQRGARWVATRGGRLEDQ